MEVGRDFGKQGKVEFQILSEGKGSKREKHRPSLENFQVVARRVCVKMRNLGDLSDGKCLIRYIKDRGRCMNIRIQVFLMI